MTDDAAREKGIYQALMAVDEVAAAIQAHLIEEHHADPENADGSASSSHSLTLLQQARERLGEGLRAIDGKSIGSTDGISLRT